MRRESSPYPASRRPRMAPAKGATMTDDTDRPGETEEPRIEGEGLLDDAEGGPIETVSVREDRPSRLVGLLALVLGLAGALVALVSAFLFLRLLFTASDTADTAMEPVASSFERLEERIDQTDDLVDREGIPDDRMDELRARVDGLVDVSSAARQGFVAVDRHPLYRLLPAELAALGESLAVYKSSAEAIDESIGSRPSVRPAVAASVADRLDTMQAGVSDTRSGIATATTSLRRWLRLAAFIGFLVSLWGLWGQVVLARRGWRGTRARTL